MLTTSPHLQEDQDCCHGKGERCCPHLHQGDGEGGRGGGGGGEGRRCDPHEDEHGSPRGRKDLHGDEQEGSSGGPEDDGGSHPGLRASPGG